MRPALLVSAALLARALLPSPAPAQVNALTGEFILGDQEHPAPSAPKAVLLDQGRLLVAWRGAAEGDGSTPIRGRFVEADGTVSGEAPVVLIERAHQYDLASGLRAPEGVVRRVTLVWSEADHPTGCIFGRRLSGTGDFLVDLEPIPVDEVGDCPTFPRALATRSDIAAVVFPTTASDMPGVVFQNFFPDGRRRSSLRVGDVTPPTDQAVNPVDAQVAVNGHSSAVVVWRDGNPDGSVSLQARQIFAASGTAGVRWQIGPAAPAVGLFPRVAMTRPITFPFVLWYERSGVTSSPFTTPLRGRIYNFAGETTGAPIEVELVQADTLEPVAVASDREGNFVVVWRGEVIDDFFPVTLFARVYSSFGTPLSGAIPVAETRPERGALVQPTVALADDGRFLVAWRTGRPEANSQIKARLFQADFSGTCIADMETLCLQQGRFAVEVEWRDFQGNTGRAKVVPTTSGESGLFWFFEPDNWELLVKVLDACSFANRFWVFSAAVTNVEYTLRVTDTRTGQVRTYTNPLGENAPAITDTGAFRSCP